MYHQPYYSQSQQQTSFYPNHGQNQYFMPTSSSYFYGPNVIPNASSQNLNFSRIFEFPPMSSHGFNSMATGNYMYNDMTNQQQQQQKQQQWKPTTSKNQQPFRRSQAYHFQDKSTYYYMSDPIITHNNRITIQLTKVHIGKNGDQQRVFVEQEFSNQHEFKKFVKNLKYNFEKTFNNRATGTQSSNENLNRTQDLTNKKSGVVVIEEPDEEPKVYEQHIYNENIKTRQNSSSDIKYPLANITKPNNHDQYPRPSFNSSNSTICQNRRRKNKGKQHHKHNDNKQNRDEKQHHRKSSNYHYRNYELPPRFQQQYFNKENIYPMKNDFNNQYWRFNRYPNPMNNHSYSFILSMNDNFSAPTASFFAPNNQDFYTNASTHFMPFTDQQRAPPAARHRQGKQHRRQQQQPTTIVENRIYTNPEQRHTRVFRTRSDCRIQNPYQNRQQIQQYLDCGVNMNQRNFIRFISPSTPLYPPQRRLIRNTQVQYRLYNPYRLNAIRF